MDIDLLLVEQVVVLPGQVDPVDVLEELCELAAGRRPVERVCKGEGVRRQNVGRDVKQYDVKRKDVRRPDAKRQTLRHETLTHEDVRHQNVRREDEN